MLHNLHVKNFALIDEAEVEFGPGLNILTGETGAGKSLLMGSVGLALGGRYHGNVLRTGASTGLVELTFSVNEKISQALSRMDLYPEDGMVTLSRRLMEGRSICRINGETVSAAVLKEVSSLLIDIHGQHENQTLLQKKNHLALLDLYGKEKIDPLKVEMERCWNEWRTLSQKIEENRMDENTRRRELSLARFEAEEIENAALLPGEDEAVEETYRRMTESRKVTEAIGETYESTCAGERQNASDLLSRAIRSFQTVADFDQDSSQLYGQLIEIDSLLNDFNRELAEYEKSFEFSEEEFSQTEQRLNQINHLKSKYGTTLDAVLAYCEEKRKRQKELEDYEQRMEELAGQTEEALEKMEHAAARLHQAREEYAPVFEKEILLQLKELNFPDAKISLRVTQSPSVSSGGKDEAEFYFSANPGEPLKPLGATASGGELSRVMLAVKTVLADEEDTPTLIFDEIDTGISGITAGKVAGRLRRIAKSRQILCITHLPQIAAASDCHYLIEKEAREDSVKTKIHRLDEEASVQETARLLGGEKLTEGMIESARELKELAKEER